MVLKAAGQLFRGIISATHSGRSILRGISLATHRVLSLLLLLALCSFGCTPSQDEVSKSESEPNEQLPGTNEMSPEELASVLEGGFATIQYAIKTAACAELAFKFDVALSKQLFAASFDAHIRYFESQQKRLFGTDDSDWAISGARERAALALGRVLGSTDARLIQSVRDQGGGVVIAAAKEKYRDDGCPAQ